MIRLTHLMNEAETFTAINKSTGKTSVFKSKDARDAAIKAGTHADKDEKAVKGGDAPAAEKPNMFSKDSGYDSPDVKKSEDTPSASLSTDDDGMLTDDAANSVENLLNKVLGGEGTAEINDNGSIEYTIADENGDWNTALYIGANDGTFMVSVESQDGDAGEDSYQEFETEKEAMDYAVQLAKQYKKELGGGEEAPKEEPKAEPKQQRKGNPAVNKATKAKAEELGITPQKLGKDEYQKKMAQAAYEALTDANFHSEARELIAKLEGKPELAEKPDYPKMDDPKFDEKMKAINAKYASEYSDDVEDDARDLGVSASQEAGWDGGSAVDGIAFALRMNGYHKLADTIQSVIKENKSMRLSSMLSEVSDYPVYHNSYTHAIEAAKAYALKKGYEISDDEMWTKVAMNSKRPSVGKTTRVSLELTRGGKVQKKMLHIQVYGTDRYGYELNAYIN